MRNYRFSIVVPLYRSAVHLHKLIAFIYLNFSDKLNATQIIFVIDGCREEYPFGDSLNEFGDYKILYLNKNYGQYVATVCGIAVADADYIITMDADMYLQELIFSRTLIEINPYVDLIYADLEYSERDIWRKAGSFLFNHMIRRLTNMKYKAHRGSSYRIIKKELKDKLTETITFPILIDVSLLTLSNNIFFISINGIPTPKSSYSLLKLLPLPFELNYFVILARITKAKKFEEKNYISKMILKSTYSNIQ